MLNQGLFCFIASFYISLQHVSSMDLKSPTLAQHAKVHGLILEFIKPGRPTQNAFIER